MLGQHWMGFEGDRHHDSCIATASKQSCVKSAERDRVKQVDRNNKNDNKGPVVNPQLGANIPKCSQHVCRRRPCQMHSKTRQQLEVEYIQHINTE